MNKINSIKEKENHNVKLKYKKYKIILHLKFMRNGKFFDYTKIFDSFRLNSDSFDKNRNNNCIYYAFIPTVFENSKTYSKKGKNIFRKYFIISFLIRKIKNLFYDSQIKIFF